MNIFLIINAIIIFWCLSKVMSYIVKQFIVDKNYFFYQNQKFSLIWLLISVKRVISNKVNSQSIILFILSCIAYAVSKFYLHESHFSSLLEGILIILIASSCIMDLKTMSIDAKLSYVVVFVLILNFLFLKSLDINKLYCTMGLLVFFGLIIFIIEKIKGKIVIGGADIDFFIGMIIYFSYQQELYFIIFAGFLGILTKIILQYINKTSKNKSEFPFLPAISVAFYFIRLLPINHTSIFNVF